MSKVVLPVVNRSCGDCTKCCEGWLNAQIYDKPMFKGQSCYYLGNQCTIYDQRPNGCHEYMCEWLKSDVFPEWMKPSVSNFIVTLRSVGAGISYYTAQETGSKVDSVVLKWLIQWALSKQVNLHYEVGGRSYMIGSVDFINAMAASKSTKDI